MCVCGWSVKLSLWHTHAGFALLKVFCHPHGAAVGGRDGSSTEDWMSRIAGLQACCHGLNVNMQILIMLQWKRSRKGTFRTTLLPLPLPRSYVSFLVYAISWRGEERNGVHSDFSIRHLWQHTKWELVEDRSLVKKSVNIGSLVSSSALSSPREAIKGDVTYPSCLFALTTSHRPAITELLSMDNWWSRRSWKIIHVRILSLLNFHLRWSLRCLLLEKCVVGHEKRWGLMVQKFWKHPTGLKGWCLSSVVLWQQHSPCLEPFLKSLV